MILIVIRDLIEEIHENLGPIANHEGFIEPQDSIFFSLPWFSTIVIQRKCFEFLTRSGMQAQQLLLLVLFSARSAHGCLPWHCGPQIGWLMRTAQGHVDPSARENQGSSIPHHHLDQVGRTWQIVLFSQATALSIKKQNKKPLKISVEQGLVVPSCLPLCCQSPAESPAWKRQSIDTDGFSQPVFSRRLTLRRFPQPGSIQHQGTTLHRKVLMTSLLPQLASCFSHFVYRYIQLICLYLPHPGLIPSICQINPVITESQSWLTCL